MAPARSTSGSGGKPDCFWCQEPPIHHTPEEYALMNMQKTSQQDPFAPLQGAKVAQLVTFRRNGHGVATPVGIQLANGKVYFTTWSTTGKVKRLAHNPRVTLAPFAKMRRK